MPELLPYLEIGCEEVINACRTAAYVGRTSAPRPHPSWALGSCQCCCPPGQSSASFSTPALDPAPWYDATVPESADFFGFYPTMFEWIDVPVARVGGSNRRTGLLRPTVRQLRIQGYIVSNSCRGTTYGTNWLLAQLTETSGGGCCIETARVFSRCPTDATDARDIVDLRLVTMRELTEGDNDHLRCDQGAAYEIMLAAEEPCLYRTSPVETVILNGPYADMSTALPFCIEEEEAVAAACGLPLGCAPSAIPDFQFFTSSCFCDPLFTNWKTVSSSVELPAAYSVSPVLTITTGEFPLQNARVYLIADEGLGCPSSPAGLAGRLILDELDIFYLPAGTELVADSRTGAVVAYCTGSCSAGDIYLSKPWSGASFTCGKVCLAVRVDALSTADDVEFRADLYLRECA